MTILNLGDFLKKCILKKDTMNESELQRIYNYPIYPRDSRFYSGRGFVNIDDGSMGGSLWTCFILKDIKLYYHDPYL